jgi:spermidine/putrescine transport system permease protein
MSAITSPDADVRPRDTEPVRAGRPGLPSFLRNPWGRPRFLVATTWLYMLWALAPVAIAILFSFNAGKSRSNWQGFSTRWWTGNPSLSVFHNATYTSALEHSLLLAALDMAIATPLGVLLALGLSRWRGRGSGAANSLMLIPLVTPEIVMAVSLLVVFTQLALVPFSLIHLGTTAQVVGQVTFSLSYVVVIIRSRLASIGNQYEEAARDLGASPSQAIRLVLIPLLMPAILASLLIVFALSIDDFVVTQYMSSNAATQTIPMILYGTARGGTSTPALNALATIMIVITLGGITLAYFIYTIVGRRLAGAEAGVSALRELSGIDAA